LHSATRIHEVRQAGWGLVRHFDEVLVTGDQDIGLPGGDFRNDRNVAGVSALNLER